MYVIHEKIQLMFHWIIGIYEYCIVVIVYLSKSFTNFSFDNLRCGLACQVLKAAEEEVAGDSSNSQETADISSERYVLIIEFEGKY